MDHNRELGVLQPATPSVDPVCGMTVDPATAAGSSVHEGHTFYFCSTHCLHKFEAAPHQYVRGEPPQTAPRVPPGATVHTCPMHPEVRQDHPGNCPQCGMGLEAAGEVTPTTKVEYTCPMHPEIVRDQPGSCPNCGMALEPRTVSLEEGPNPELVDMSRRFWVGLVLGLPVFLLAMADLIPGKPLQFLPMTAVNWVQLVLATPVVLWCGWPFFERAWDSVVHRSPNMFTLIAPGRRGRVPLQPRRPPSPPGCSPQDFARPAARSSRTSTRRPW